MNTKNTKIISLGSLWQEEQCTHAWKYGLPVPSSGKKSDHEIIVNLRIKVEGVSIPVSFPSFILFPPKQPTKENKWMEIRRKSDQLRNLSQHTQISYNPISIIAWNTYLRLTTTFGKYSVHFKPHQFIFAFDKDYIPVISTNRYATTIWILVYCSWRTNTTKHSDVT